MDSDLKTNQQIYESLNDENYKDIFNDYIKYIKSCPNCKSDNYVTYIVRGRPSSALADFARVTHFVSLGGCAVGPGDLNLKCRKCNSKF